jgi:hypothetical protein
MQEFTVKYADKIQGVLSGFDRLVFRGSLRKICHPFGMEGYLWAIQVPLKEFGKHVNKVSGQVKDSALRCMLESGRPVKYPEYRGSENTGTRLGATVSIWYRIRRRTSLLPTISSIQAHF